MIDFKDLIDRIRKEQVVLFLGSGFSRKAGAPMASAITSALFDALPDDIQSDLKNQKILDIISEEFEQIFGREALISKLKEIMLFTPTDTSDHISLTKVPHFHHIITTNYDTLIEDAYGADNCYVVRETDNIENLPKDKTIIYKIHGDFKSKDHIILTKQDYTNFFSDNNEPLLWKYIQSLFITKDILFMGYSLEDSNISSIIKKIHKNLKTNTRQYFLIAPGLKPHKINRLELTNITYFDTKAEDLFPVLFDTLDKKIKSDYQKKRISIDTFRRYSNEHSLQPVVSECADSNKIQAFNFTDQAKVKINVSGLDKNTAEALQNNDTYQFNSCLPNTNIPAMRLTREMIENINISINGLTVSDNDDCQTLFISPACENISTTILIPSRKFKEKVNLQKFNMNREQICLLLETEPYTLKIIFSFSVDMQLNCALNVNAKNNCKNLQEAIKWMDLLIALWNSEEVLIKEYRQIPIKSPVNNKEGLEMWMKIKKYFENMNEIENLYDVEFSSINVYSEEAFQMSESLIHSYREDYLKETIKKREYMLDVGGNQDGKWDVIQVSSQVYSLTIIENSVEQIDFNGLKFDLKQKYIVIPQCIILGVTRENGKVSKVKLRITSEYIYAKYTNKELTEFPESHKQKRLIEYS